MTMKTLAMALLLAGTLAAQETQEKKAPSLTDAQAAGLGGFVADKLDTNPSAEELERAIVEKIDALQKAAPGTTTTEPAKGKGKKKAGKKSANKGSNPQNPDTLKNGLNESDRTAFGKFVLGEINADRKGQALADGVKKELERIRAERVKASSEAPAKKKKGKKKP